MEPNAQEILETLGLFISKESGEKKSNCAVIIPYGASDKLAGKHLAYLAQQKNTNFDVILLGKKMDVKIPPTLNTLRYSEIYPLGSCGGFTLGQVLAYCLGYEYLINADVDCFPISENLVETLQKRANETGKVVMPLSVFDRNYKMDEIKNNYCCINQYGICPRGIFEKFGFPYFRFFKGGEDQDAMGRLGMENMLMLENSVRVEHKNLEANFMERMNINGNKYLYYEKNWVMGNVLLFGYALKKLRLFRALRYLIFIIMIRAQSKFVYHGYPEFSRTFFDGLNLDLGIKYPARRDGAKRFLPDEKMQAAKIGVEGEEKDVIDFRSRGWMVNTNKAKVVLHLLRKWLEVFFSKAEYVEPSEKFFDNYKFFQEYLILAKPIKYKDGYVYYSTIRPINFALNLIEIALWVPVICIMALVALPRMDKLGYPLELRNLKSNLLAYHEFVKGL